MCLNLTAMWAYNLHVVPNCRPLKCEIFHWNNDEDVCVKNNGTSSFGATKFPQPKMPKIPPFLLFISGLRYIDYNKTVKKIYIASIANVP